ncbi:ABC transporter substrate-binding protein [Nocardioides sp. AN3]
MINVDWATGNASLDPASACAADDTSLIHNLYPTLTTYGVKAGPEGTAQYDPSKIVPSFATAWKVSPDGKTYTFTLHQGAKFDDGSPIDAAAVKYSIERAITTGACGAFYLQAGLMAPPLVSTIETPDASTVVMKLSRPNADFLAGLATPAGSIVNPKIVEAHGGVKAHGTNEWMASHVAGGAGPYVLESYQPNNKVVLKANAAYFGTKPANTQINISYVTAPSTLLIRAKSGASDVTLGMPLQSAKSLSSEACCRVIANDAPQFAQVALSNVTAPLDNEKVRQALTLATPFQDLLKNIAFGFGSLFYGPVVPNVAGYDAAGSKPVDFDLAAAKKALAESGVKTPLDLSMIVNSASPAAVQLAVALQGAWADLDVNLQVKQMAPSEFTPTYTTGKFQSALTIEGPGVPTASYQLTLTSSCSSMFNNAKVCIPGLDALLDKARAAGPADSAPIYAQITQLWRQDWPRIPLYSAQGVTVLNKKVDQYQYAKFVDFSTWSLKK